MRGRFTLNARQRIIALVIIVLGAGLVTFLYLRGHAASGVTSGPATNPQQLQPPAAPSPTPPAPTVPAGYVGISVPLDVNNPLTPFLTPKEIIDVLIERDDGTIVYAKTGLLIITVQPGAATGGGIVAPGGVAPTASISGSMFVALPAGSDAGNLVSLINANAFKIHYAIVGQVPPTTPTPVPTAKPATPAPTPAPTAAPTPTPTAAATPTATPSPTA